jgi:hypothetical protein
MSAPGLVFISFASLGWKAFKMIKKDHAAPVRATHDLVQRSRSENEALVNAGEDKNWMVHAAALGTCQKKKALGS